MWILSVGLRRPGANQGQTCDPRAVPRAARADHPIDFQVDRLDKIELVPGVIPALLRLRDAGYSFVMASNYNARPRAPEALTRGAEWRQIRAREAIDALMADETGFLLP